MTTQPGGRPERTSPYQGLEPFDEADAAFFFGRERETRLILASLFAAPLTLLYGASGVGKSSVLRAGVLRRLRERADVIPVVFPTLGYMVGSKSDVIRGWQTDPLGGVKEAVALSLYAAASDDANRRREYQDAVLRNEMAPLTQFLAAVNKVSGRRLMIILDQFEEYSLYHPEDDAFARQFPLVIETGDLSVHFLVSLREDSLARLDRFKGTIPSLWDSYRRIDHLDRAAAEDAIRLPLGEHNRRLAEGEPQMKIENTLVDAVLRDVQTERVQFEATGSGTLGTPPNTDGRIETPYLQLVMTRLWEREQAQRSSLLRLTTLQSEGGAADIVRGHLDRVMEQFSPDERDVAARVFHRLVTPSGAKIAFTAKDLAEYEALEPSKLAPILQRLEEGNRRILRRVASRPGEEARYEIFHDRLGKAILAWRSKRVAEQAKEASQQQEADVRRVAEETQTRLRDVVDKALQALNDEDRGIWTRMMFYLVSTTGQRLVQSPKTLAELSQQSVEHVSSVLQQLLDQKIVRNAYSPDDDQYEIVNDPLAAALLEWHSRYTAQRSRKSGDRSLPGLAELRSAPPVTPAAAFPYEIVKGLFRDGRIVVFIGAGVTLSARGRGQPERPHPPSSREFKELLARQSRFPMSEFEASDVAEVASYFAQALGRNELDRRVRESYARADFAPSNTHRLLASIAKSYPMLILSTNFDDLMERSLREASVKYIVSSYEPRQQAPFLIDERMLRETSIVFRLHGAPADDGHAANVVLTEEDQIDWLLAMGDDRAMPTFIRAELGSKHLLSLGHSARDWSQRALLRGLRGDKRREQRQHWSVALDPSPLSVLTWRRYDIEVYNIDLNEWSAKMENALPRVF